MKIQMVMIMTLIPILVSARPLTKSEETIVGEWRSGSKCYVFNSDGEFINIKDVYARPDNRTLSVSGKWRIKSNRLLLTLTNKIVTVGGVVADDPMIGGKYIAEGKNVRKGISDSICAYSFSGVFYDKVARKYRITINGQKYWKSHAEDSTKINEALFADIRSMSLVNAEYEIMLGADVNSSVMQGWTPLHEACKNNYFEIAKLLVEKGADVNSSDKNGYRPVYLAVENKNIKLTKYLIHRGAFVNIQAEPLGRLLTPLHVAVMNSDTAMVKLLLENGADWHIKTAQGKTALDLARGTKDKRIEKLILAYSQKSAKLKIKGEYIQLIRGGKIKTMGKLASSDAFPFGFSSLYAFSPDSAYIAFVAKTKKGYDIFLVSNIGERLRITTDGKIDGRTTISWDREGKAFLYNEDGRIILCSTEGYWQNTLTNPPEGYEDFKPSFKTGHMVKFFRGTRFEYSFSGSEYEVRISGSHCRKVPNGEVMQPENTKGNEDEGY